MAAQSERATLRVGAGESDITPKSGMQLGGDIGRYRPAELLLDRLYARALVLEGSGRKVCIISTDLIAISDEWAHEIRRRVGEMFGFDPRAVMLHSVQNHAAPAIGNLACRDSCGFIPSHLNWLRGGDEAYNEIGVRGILESVRLALGNLDPARVGVGSGLEARVAFNRRFIMRDGSSACHPSGPGLDNVLQAEGPMDPELGVVCFTGEELQTRAAILSYTCHPTHGYPHRFVIGDWPGKWCESMKALLGPDCVPLVLNGCCGNIHHSNHLEPARVSTQEMMAEALTETATGVLKGLSYTDDVPLDWRSANVKVPYRAADPAELEAARKLLADHPEPIWLDEAKTAVSWDWVYAVSMVDLADLRAEQGEHECEVQLIRIGDTALMGIPGEPFVELQLKIKLNSPVRRTFIGHMCNGAAGYIPTHRAFQGGGYETNACNWSKLAPEAIDLIGEKAEELLGEVFGAK